MIKVISRTEKQNSFDNELAFANLLKIFIPSMGLEAVIIT